MIKKYSNILVKNVFFLYNVNFLYILKNSHYIRAKIEKNKLFKNVIIQ